MSEFKQLISILVLVLVASALLWIGGSYMEARAFNRVTGKSVSTWDAMWIELRVQEGTDR